MKLKNNMKKCWQILLVVMIFPLLASNLRVIASDASEEDGFVIIKYLQMPHGTTTPEVTFTFSFTFIEEVTKKADSHIAAPVIIDQTVAFDIKTPAINVEVQSELGITDASIKVVATTTDPFLEHVAWENVGEYVFEVQKKINSDVVDWGESIESHGSVGLIHVHVEEIEGTLTVTHVEVANQVNQLSFLSTFSRRTDDDFCLMTDTTCELMLVPCEEEHMFCEEICLELSVCDVMIKPCTDIVYCDLKNLLPNRLTFSKNVSGTLSDVNMPFDIELELLPHSLEKSDTNIGGYIWTYVENVGWIKGTRIELSDNSAKFQLRHQQALILDPVLVGTHFVATKLNHAPYTPMTTVTTAEGTTVASAMTTDIVLVGEDMNAIVFSSTLNPLSPTELLINNLPALVVMLWSIGFIAVIVTGNEREYFEK